MNTFAPKLKLAFRQGILPFLSLLVVVGILVALFFFGVNSGGDEFIVSQHQEGGELSSPTRGRFISMIVAFVASMAFALLANKVGKSEKHTDICWTFLTGAASGTLLWQCVGECSWHFGVDYYCETLGQTISLYFPRIECLSSLFILLVIIILLSYCWKMHAFHWGVWCVVITFMTNWIGHFLMLAPYPFVAATFAEAEWYKLSGITVGSLMMIYSLYLMVFKSTDIKYRLSTAMMMYGSLGIITSGFL